MSGVNCPKYIYVGDTPNYSVVSVADSSEVLYGSSGLWMSVKYM